MKREREVGNKRQRDKNIEDMNICDTNASAYM